MSKAIVLECYDDYLKMINDIRKFRIISEARNYISNKSAAGLMSHLVSVTGYDRCIISEAVLEAARYKNERLKIHYIVK